MDRLGSPVIGYRPAHGFLANQAEGPTKPRSESSCSDSHDASLPKRVIAADVRVDAIPVSGPLDGGQGADDGDLGRPPTTFTESPSGTRASAP